MQIFIKSYLPNFFAVIDCEPSDTIADIKEKIQDKKKYLEIHLNFILMTVFFVVVILLQIITFKKSLYFI